jgi:hypothetical protein
MTYEITPNPDVATTLGKVISYTANSVSGIYDVARDIAAVSGITGAIYVGGTNITAGNTLIARVRYSEPWYSVATDCWVITGTDYRTRPV